MADIQDLYCCGVKELQGVRENPKDIIDEVAASNIEDQGFRYLIYTDTKTFPGGKRLTNFIRSKKLGSVTSPRMGVNPNSGNKLKAYLWRIDLQALRKYYHAHLAESRGNSDSDYYL
jgi:hypothetical protein